MRAVPFFDRRLVAATVAGVLLCMGGLVAGAAWFVHLGPSRPAEVEPPLARTGEAAAVEIAAAPTARSQLTDVLPPPAPVAAPAAPPPVVEVIAPPRRVPVIVRRHSLDDEDLRRQLLSAPEIRLDSDETSHRQILATARVRSHRIPHPTLALLTSRADLAGLPMRMGVECQAGKEAAENLEALSIKLHQYLHAAVGQPGTGDPRLDVAVLRRKLFEGRQDQPCEWLQPEAVPTLVQMLQVENKPARLLLVELLAGIPGPAAGTALAQRALFDLVPEVRAAAVQALDDRPRPEYRATLLDGFRYPWDPVADHAAEALVALRDEGAVPQMLQMLGEPGPRAPFLEGGDKGVRVRELVRVNHVGNCLLCHAPSAGTADPVRGRVPSPGEARGGSSYSGGSSQDLFVRADVTYLRQDFSVPQPANGPRSGPRHQRYDYLVRTRPAEAGDWKHQSDSPQRRALRDTLAELEK
jgi:hypothetical protein